MDWVLAGLLAAAGLLAGVLAAFVWDGRVWEKLIRASEQQRQQMQTRLNQTERKLAKLHRRRHKLEQELAAAKQELTAVQTQQSQTSQDLSHAQSRIQELESQLAGMLRQLTETRQLRQRLAEAEARLKEAEPIKSQLAARLAAAQHQLRFTGMQGKKELETIHGIGPVYARKLGDAGISQLVELAEQTPEQLSQILGLKPGHQRKMAGWIAEARALTDSLAAEEGESDTAAPPPQSKLS